MQRPPAGLAGSQSVHTPILPSRNQRQRQRMTQAVAIPEIATLASTVQTFVDTIASAAPQPLQPAVQVIGGDIASVAALSPTLPGLLRLTVSGTAAAALRLCVYLLSHTPRNSSSTALPRHDRSCSLCYHPCICFCCKCISRRCRSLVQ